MKDKKLIIALRKHNTFLTVGAADRLEAVIAERDALRKIGSRLAAWLPPASSDPALEETMDDWISALSAEKDGVCIGEHAPGTIASEAASKLAQVTAERDELLRMAAHIHRSKDGNGGRCVHCGHDLRHKVHHAENVELALSAQRGEQP